MAERFDAYYDSISCKSTGRHIHDDGEFVLASDYAALESELARVKAESLRVVESECQDMNIASDWYMTPDGLGWLGYDRRDCECVETPHGYNKFDECKKVRLERWEDEG